MKTILVKRYAIYQIIPTGKVEGNHWEAKREYTLWHQETKNTKEEAEQWIAGSGLRCFPFTIVESYENQVDWD
jgi:hypothetical protein